MLEILPRIDQRRFTNEDIPALICVKKIENEFVICEELTRDTSKTPRSFTFTEEEFSMLPYNCPFFIHNQMLYEEYCKQRNAQPYFGFRTIEDMRLFHCGFWLNIMTLPKKTATNEINVIPSQ